MSVHPLKSLTALGLVTLLLTAGCSSQEDREAYDKYYGSGREAREEAALSAAPVEAAKPAAATAAPASTDTSATEAPKEEETAPKEEAPKEAKRKETPAEIATLLNKNTCSACHLPYDRLVGPAYSEVAKRNYTPERIVELVHKPEPANWPDYPPMAALPNVPKEDIIKIAKWINSL